MLNDTIKNGLFFVLMTLVWVNPVYANDSADNLVNFGIMDLEPYAYTTENGITEGYMYDIINKIKEIGHLTGKVTVLPVKRLLGDLKSGSIDCSFLARMNFTESNFEMLLSIDKKIEMVVAPKAGISLHTYDSLKDIVIAVPRGVQLDGQFDGDNGLDKFITNGYLQSAKLLQRGRVDAMYGVWDSYLFVMRKIGMTIEEIGDRYIFNTVSLWLMCSPEFHNEAVKKKLIEVTNLLRDQGVFKKIIGKYLGET